MFWEFLGFGDKTPFWKKTNIGSLHIPGGVRPDLPHKSWPIGVSVEVAPELLPMLLPILLPPQESFILFSEVEVGLLKLHVGEVNPKVFSANADPEVEEVLLLWFLIKSIAVGATDPGVNVGSSSGFFKPGPFQG